MLDLVAVAGQLSRMRADLALLDDETRPRLEEGLRAWGAAAELGPALRDRLARARTSWLVADPLEPLKAYPIPDPRTYRVLACDGSQVFPDRHELPHCFLVNVGVVDIDYSAPSATLTTRPKLAWLPEDMYPAVGGERQEADARVVGARRFAAECDALTETLAGAERGPPSIALIDGTLLLWWLEPDPARLRGLPSTDLKSQTFASLSRFLATAQAAGALAAGYLSAPRSTDVVSMLKVVLCTEEPVDCDRCPYSSGAKTWTPRRPGASRLLLEPQKPCEEADSLSDAAVFAALLSPRQRSPRFRSAARVAEAYEAPIDFVYLHTGGEIARLEFPAWVQPPDVDLLSALVLDQCDKGLGYPVALAEAHEQAVVRAQERRAFLDLVRRIEGTSHTSLKLQRKRMSVV